MAEDKRSPVAAIKMPRGNATDGRAAYINAMYDASDKARTAQLEAAYSKAASDMAAARTAAGRYHDRAANAYGGQMAAAGDAVRAFAAPRGLNTGAGSQAAMAMSNQGIVDANAMDAARAQTEADLDRQSVALEQSYLAQRQQLAAANMQSRNKALYEDAVLADEARRQQAQFEQAQNMQRFQNALAQRQAQLKAAAKTKDAGTYKLGRPRAEDVDFTGYDPYTAYQMALSMAEEYKIPSSTALTPSAYSEESASASIGAGLPDYNTYLTNLVREAINQADSQDQAEADELLDYASMFL